jgi:NAD(P)-dependent dehydrogenase (short-subunit alcohol dehydrogenase family)
LISAGQVDLGIDLKEVCEMTKLTSVVSSLQTSLKTSISQLPPSSLQTKEAHEKTIGLERPALPTEIARVAGFLASGFSSYITGANLVADGGAT